VVTVGPSFATQRAEARLSMTEFIQYYPQAAPLIGDLYAEANDWARADEVAERLKHLLPPEIKYKKDLEEAIKQGVPQDQLPQPPQPPPPPPSEQLKVEIEKIRLQIEEARLATEKERTRAIEIQSIISLNANKETIAQIVQEVLAEAKNKLSGKESKVDSSVTQNTNPNPNSNIGVE
jgi:hypothetical protein